MLHNFFGPYSCGALGKDLTCPCKGKPMFNQSYCSIHKNTLLHSIDINLAALFIISQFNTQFKIPHHFPLNNYNCYVQIIF